MNHQEKKIKEFVFFSAGPVGDHVILVDFADRFFEASGVSSTIIMKHPSSFLEDFITPYKDHVSFLRFTGLKGKISLIKFIISSIFIPRCYVNVLPIIPPLYYKLFAYFIRFCTRSRFVGFNLEGSKSFPAGKGSSYFLGKNNLIDARIDKNLFYQEANRMLLFLGYKENMRPPYIKCIEDKKLLTDFSLAENSYLVMHLAASHPDRSFPSDKWNRIIKALQKELPEASIIFTGSSQDKEFLEACLEGVEQERICRVYGKATAQQLLTLHTQAKLNVTVHTGNAHFINMLHVPVVNINIKGVFFFKFFYNEKETELVSKKECTCDPYERNCTMLPYKGEKYMACLFNIPEEEVIKTITLRFKE